MLNFTPFNWQVKSHLKLAEDGVDVLFYTDDDTTIRKGFLFLVEYDPDSDEYVDKHLISYKAPNGELTIDADGVYFAQIKVRTKWEDA